jgi:hypothetical protein
LSNAADAADDPQHHTKVPLRRRFALWVVQFVVVASLLPAIFEASFLTDFAFGEASGVEILPLKFSGWPAPEPRDVINVVDPNEGPKMLSVLAILLSPFALLACLYLRRWGWALLGVAGVGAVAAAVVTPNVATLQADGEAVIIESVPGKPLKAITLQDARATVTLDGDVPIRFSLIAELPALKCPKESGSFEFVRKVGGFDKSEPRFNVSTWTITAKPVGKATHEITASVQVCGRSQDVTFPAIFDISTERVRFGGTIPLAGRAMRYRGPNRHPKLDSSLTFGFESRRD